MSQATGTRDIARKAIESTVNPAVWKKNGALVEELRKTIKGHRILKHPLIGAMDSGKFDKNALIKFHLEFGTAFAQIFTDTLLRAMFTCSQLEEDFGPLGKLSARFLLQMNMLDELGFTPSTKGEWEGSPHDAHYVKFNETLHEMGVNHKEVYFYQASKESRACRSTFEDNYNDHVLLTCVLATSESVFDKFAGPWARNVEKKTKVQVKGGYHDIHALTDDGTGIDDDHSDDLWVVFQQCVPSERYDEVRTLVTRWLDTWAKFADSLAKG